jgi:hypothetical protein
MNQSRERWYEKRKNGNLMRSAVYNFVKFTEYTILRERERERGGRKLKNRRPLSTNGCLFFFSAITILVPPTTMF